MKIYNNTNITYSAIEHNSRKNTKQNFPADLEKKMTQYTDTLSISKTGQESFRHLSSVSSMDYQNRFEKEVTDIFVKEDTESVKSDSFEHYVNRMATAYNKMKNSIITANPFPSFMRNLNPKSIVSRREIRISD